MFLAVRRSRFGRMLSALRDSPTACQMLGMNLVAMKLRVFGLSALLAGAAGALLGALQVRVGRLDFLCFRSLTVLLVATIFGITSVSGALLGALFFVVLPEALRELGSEGGGGLTGSQALQPLIIGLLAIAVARRPEGLAGQLRAGCTAASTRSCPLADAAGPRGPPRSPTWPRRCPSVRERPLVAEPVAAERRAPRRRPGRRAARRRARPTARSRCCTASTSSCPAGRSWPCSGPNGAGKTHDAQGDQRRDAPDRGQRAAWRATTSPARRPSSSRGSGVCLIPEGRGIFPNLTVRENMLMDTFACGRKATTAELEEIAYERFPRLGERRHQLAGTLSGGEQQMLALGRGPHHRPGA